jgi:tetraacyldisaccharide 4'-kinase
MARPFGSHLIPWLWTSRRLDARLARVALLPLAGAWHVAMALRALPYRAQWRVPKRLPLPTVAVGNLTVGGSGKTPLASWIAGYYAALGYRPGILLRGYRGGDEALVHTELVPEAVVVSHPNRHAAADRALAANAQVLVLDDAFQRLDVDRDLNVAVVSAESSYAAPWPVPAGPWRERWAALARADIVVVTRRRVDSAAARALARSLEGRLRTPCAVAVAHLAVHQYQGMLSGRLVPATALAGRRVVAAAAIGDPESFLAQTQATGAVVQAATWRDHHQFSEADLVWLARAAGTADYLILTRKDAVKLRRRWPAGAPEPLVAVLEVEWEAGAQELTSALQRIAPPPTTTT